MGKYVKRLPSSRGQKLVGALYECVLCQILFSPRIHAPILPINYKLQKDYKTFSIWLQNKDKTETHNTLCNFSKSPHMFRSLGYMAWYIMRFVHFAIYARLAVCSCECGRSSCLCSLWPCGHWESESVSVFDGFMYL